MHYAWPSAGACLRITGGSCHPDNRFAYQAITGNIFFDTYDAPKLIKKGQFDELILRAMGVAIGFGNLNYPAGLVDTGKYVGDNGKAIWSEDWGCTTDAPPLQFFFSLALMGFGYTWDASCLTNELMAYSGPFFPDGFETPPPKAKLSKLTIAAFEDLGFEVNYDAADD